MDSKIVITIGNPNGIGPEVISKAIKKFEKNQLQNFIVILDDQNYNIFFKEVRNLDFVIFPSKDYNYICNPGEKSIASGLLSYRFLEKAVELIKKKEAKAIVTGPVSKELIVKAGIKNFVDHTSFFARVFNRETFMLFYSEDFCVTLATIHIPLKKVVKQIKPFLVEKVIIQSIEFLKKTKENSFRIGVCGINPHAGENGLLGRDEYKLIKVVEKFKRAGYHIEGPIPADTAFYKAYTGWFDLIVAMYHDQGLAPFKMLHFNNGVNVTLGLPFVRTSPDHGTAFDIAGKGIADESSMFEAIKLAIKLNKKI